MKKSKIPKTMPTLDLHGFKVDEVFDALDGFIRKSEAEGHHKIRIITGIGSGKVKAKTLEYLKIANYKPEKENEGALLISL